MTAENQVELQLNKSLSTLVEEAFAEWDQKSSTSPVLKIVAALATEGRFDEITQITIAWLDGYSKIPHVSGPLLKGAILKQLCGVILNQYVYKQPGVDANVATELWRTEAGSPSVRKFALRPGKLGHVMRNFINQAVAESEKVRR